MSDTRLQVAAALHEAGDRGLSGEVLAHALGVSRMAVSKHVASLRAEGYDIRSVPGAGYTLLAVPDLPLPAEVGPLRTNTLFAELTGGHETGSTNDDARALARGGAPEGTVVLASRQTAGRGRLGRTWSSPAGGVYLSAVLRPPVPLASVPSLALAVALGTAHGLERLGADVSVKWPNDVFAGDGKVAGVLLETSAESDRVEWVVAGVGVNVRATGEGSAAGAPADAPGAGLLGAILPGVRTAPVAAAVLDGIAEAYAAWLGGGFDAIRDEYSALLRGVGAPATVRDLTGAVLADGLIDGVDEDGRLVVTGANGRHAVAAGEVTLRPLTA